MDYFYGPSPAVTDKIAALEADLAELRAILAPLLDDPWRDNSDGIRADECVFCGGMNGDGSPVHYGHRAACPVLRKDELLGRS